MHDVAVALELDRHAQVLDGVVEAADLRVGDREVAPRRRRAVRELERAFEAHDCFGKVAEQAVRVAEERPEVHVGVPAELDAAAQGGVGAAQPAEVVEHLAEHRVVRSVFGRECDRARQGATASS